MIETAIQFATGLFTAAEYKAMAWLIIVTLTATHTIKYIWSLFPKQRAPRRYLYLISIIVALVAAYFVWPVTEGQWWVAGIVAAPLANIAFMLVFAALRKIWPEGAAVFNFDRRTGTAKRRVGGLRKGDPK